MDSSQPAPSGSFLPYFLRHKWKIEHGDSSAPEESTEPYPEMTRAEKSRIVHRVFSAQEIEDRMQQISKGVLVEIQKQIYKGEEAYFEDTNGHGNLFRGWDAFVDSKEIGATGAASVPQGTKRIPADCRWFSSSYRSPLKPARSNVAPVKLAPIGPSNVETFSASGTTEISSSSATGRAPLDPTPLQPETTTSIIDSIVKKESNVKDQMKEDPIPAKAELATNDEEMDKSPEAPEEESKRKHQESQPEQGANESNDRKKKRSRDETGEDKPARVMENVDAEGTADDRSSTVETGVGLDEKIETVDEPDLSRRRASNNDQVDHPELEESQSESLKTDDKAKREEPQKRRSSRNRKSS